MPICCLLLKLCICTSPSAALDYFAKKRTANKDGKKDDDDNDDLFFFQNSSSSGIKDQRVSSMFLFLTSTSKGPSQIRYVNYFYKLFNEGRTYPSKNFMITMIKLSVFVTS